jgi:hypothetical protein
MKKISCLILIPLILFSVFLCGASCVTPAAQAGLDAEPIVKQLEKDKRSTYYPAVYDEDYKDFILSNIAPESKVVSVYASTDRIGELMEKVIETRFKSFDYEEEKNGDMAPERRYFDYMSPLRPEPISAVDYSIDSALAKSMYLQEINSSSVIFLSFYIGSEDGIEAHNPYNKKTKVYSIDPGYHILNYRQEGTLRYTVQDENNTYWYGEYIIGSAVIVPDKERTEVSLLVRSYLEQDKNPEIKDLIRILSAADNVSAE